MRSFSSFFSTGLESFAVARSSSFESYKPTDVTNENDFCVPASDSSITIISLENGVIKRLQLKRKSIWKSNYVLVDESSRELGVISSSFSWKTWKTNYEILQNDSFSISEHIEILYLSIIHCIIMLNNNAAGA